MHDLFALRPYQRRVLDDPAPFRFVVKSRRIGLTYALACGAVIDAMLGRYETYYSAQTEKDTIQFAQYCRQWGELFEELLGEPVFADVPNAKGQKRLRFRSGLDVWTMTSNPRSIHGKQGHAILDEAARYDDLPGFMEAAKPMRMLGGRITLVSTEYHTETAFHQLRLRLEEDDGSDPQLKAWSLHKIFIHDAVRDGFFEYHVVPRGVTDEKGRLYTAADADRWTQDQFDDIGEHADSQLLGIPTGANELYLDRPTLIANTDRDLPVLRLKCPPQAAEWSDDERLDYLVPFLRDIGRVKLDRTRVHFIGGDYGRKGDITSIALVELHAQTGHARVVLLVELRNTPTQMQRNVYEAIIDHAPRLSRVVLDAGGVGADLAEDLVREYGRLVRPVRIQVGKARPIAEQRKAGTLNYSEILPPLKAAFDENEITIPYDREVLADLMGLRKVDGMPRVPSTRSKDYDGGQRHCDAAVALALALTAREPEIVAQSTDWTKFGSLGKLSRWS